MWSPWPLGPSTVSPLQGVGTIVAVMWGEASVNHTSSDLWIRGVPLSSWSQAGRFQSTELPGGLAKACPGLVGGRLHCVNKVGPSLGGAARVPWGISEGSIV